MEPTASDVIERIDDANNQLNTINNLLSNPANTAIDTSLYTGFKFFLELLISYLEQIFIEVGTDEIQNVVGIDFNSGQLDFEAVVTRYNELPNIIALSDNYGVDLTGSSETLGEWLSDPVSDISLIQSILQAVEATAQDLFNEIDWDDPNIGYLRSPVNLSNVSSYINSLLNATTPAEAFKLVAHDTTNLIVELQSSRYPADALKLFGYLKGWEYAKFARRVIQIDWDIYDAIFQKGVASRFWDTQD